MGREIQGGGGDRHGDLVSVEVGFTGLRQLEEGFAPNLAEDGIFVPCDAPLPPSTVVRLRIVLAGDVLLLQATGVVFWSRTSSDHSGPAGMAIRYVTMVPEFEETVRELLQVRRRRGLAVPRLDNVAMAAEWPEVTAGTRPWERPEIGYRLRVRPVGEGAADEVTQLRFFSDEEEPAPEAEASASRDAAPTSEVVASTAPPAGSEAGPRGPAAAEAAADAVADVPGDGDAGALQRAGVAFEVSFFEDDGSPDTTPRLGDSEGPEMVIDLDDADDEQDGRPSGLKARLGRWAGVLPRPLLVLEILVIVAVLWGTKWLVSRVASVGLRPGPGPVAEATITPTPSSTPSPAAAPSAEDGRAAGRDDEVRSGGAAEGAEGVLPAPASAPVPTRTPTPTARAAPRPTVAPTRTPRASAAAGLSVRDVSWTRRDGRTTVSVQADRTLAPEAVTVAALSGPPRVLVVVRGVARPFGRSLLQVGSNEIETLRIGYHPDHNPPSLHVVLDLADPAVSLVQQRVQDDRIVVTVGR